MEVNLIKLVSMIILMKRSALILSNQARSGKSESASMKISFLDLFSLTKIISLSLKLRDNMMENG